MKVYLLSIEELQEKIVSEDFCLQRLDSHRRGKAEQMKAPNAWYLSIGAGLLLQLVGYEEAVKIGTGGGICRWSEARTGEQSEAGKENQPIASAKKQSQIVVLSVTQLLERLGNGRRIREGKSGRKAIKR